MTTSLSRAIDALSTPDVRAADALRTLLVISKRMGGNELTNWVRSELDGYPGEASLPEYRKPAGLPITLSWAGGFGSSATTDVTDFELPEGLRLGDAPMRQPLAELEELAAGEKDAGAQLPIFWVAQYRQAFADGKVPGYGGMEMNHARRVFPRTMLRGVIDRVKTSALDLALELESVAPEAGSPGGPTTETQPELQGPVNVFLTNVYGPGSTVTVGDDATIATGAGAVAIRLSSGDVEGLIEAAGAYLTQDGVSELKSALEQDGGSPGTRTRGFLSKVQSGALILAGGMAGNGAYDGLIALLGQVFPGFAT